MWFWAQGRPSWGLIFTSAHQGLDPITFFSIGSTNKAKSFSEFLSVQKKQNNLLSGAGRQACAQPNLG